MVSTILLVFACVCFVLAALGASHSKINLTAAGLAAWVAALLIGTLP